LGAGRLVIADDHTIVREGLKQLLSAADDLQVIAEACARPTLRRMLDPPARRHTGPIFPYAVIYLDQANEVWIVAVMHFKQRPGYWRERLA
jgi:hypothetical protein